MLEENLEMVTVVGALGEPQDNARSTWLVINYKYAIVMSVQPTYVCSAHNANGYKTSASKWNGRNGPCIWGPVRYCPINYAVCGFQHEMISTVAITNVKVLCCRV